MGIFDRIKDAIWGTDDLTPAPDRDPVEESYLGTNQAGTGFTPKVETSPVDAALATPAPAPGDALTRTTPMARQPAVDVATQLDQAAEAREQDLNWRTSIVDLMKVVGMNASLQQRRDLARELDYGGDTNDTATMNTFLHKSLMRKLAENGGKVPSEYLD